MNAWMKVSVAVVCVGAMGCEPIDDLASSDGIDAPDVGGLDAEATEDAGRDASQEGAGGGFEGCGELATCANHDAERLELSFEEGTLTVALEGLPYAIDALAFRGNRVLYVCGICSPGDPECEEQCECEALDATPFTAAAAPVDSAFVFTFPDDDPLFEGVEWLALEWEDPCGVTQELAFEGEWHHGRRVVMAPLTCVD